MAQELSNFVVIQGDSSRRIGDGAAIWTKSFGAGGRVAGKDAILMFMVAGLTATNSDVDIKINDQTIGRIENYNGMDRRHWFTQVVNIGPNVLNDGTNELEITAVSWDGATAGDIYDDFFIKDVVCFFKKVD